MTEDLEQHLAAARERVRELSRDLSRHTLAALRAAWEDQLRAESTPPSWSRVTLGSGPRAYRLVGRIHDSNAP